MVSGQTRWTRAIKRRYGLSREAFDALLARQGGVCGICKKHRPLCVDHCHVTGKVRGLLCHKCNRGLGHYNDDPDLTRAATAYLEVSLCDELETGSPPATAGGACPSGRPAQGLCIDEPPRRRPSPVVAGFQSADGDTDDLIRSQEGARMTHTEDAAGPEPHAGPDLDVIVDAPPLSPAAPAPARGAPAHEFAPLDLAELLALDIPERGMVLDPVIPEKGLALLYAMRGTGKTHVALGIAHAVATGGGFLNWRAPRARRVLVVDGEMPAADLGARLRTIVAGTGVAAAPGMLQVLAGDLIDDGIGNLARREVQRALERCLDGVELLILDNLASLMSGQHENDAEAWTTMQQWLLRLRRRGVSVVIVHHAGKNGDQRGISNREDLLDTSISLRRPEDYSPADGARFEVHVAKGRGLRGKPALPFEAMLGTQADKAVWTVKSIEDVERARVEALLAEGLSIRDIAEETGIHRSTVHRIKRKLGRDTLADPPETPQT
jgi:AAA domain/Recombination endonuclease VII/Homeodomain-like domain